MGLGSCSRSSCSSWYIVPEDTGGKQQHWTTIFVFKLLCFRSSEDLVVIVIFNKCKVNNDRTTKYKSQCFLVMGICFEIEGLLLWCLFIWKYLMSSCHLIFMLHYFVFAIGTFRSSFSSAVWWIPNCQQLPWWHHPGLGFS